MDLILVLVIRLGSSPRMSSGVGPIAGSVVNVEVSPGDREGQTMRGKMGRKYGRAVKSLRASNSYSLSVPRVSLLNLGFDAFPVVFL